MTGLNEIRHQERDGLTKVTVPAKSQPNLPLSVFSGPKASLASLTAVGS